MNDIERLQEKVWSYIFQKWIENYNGPLTIKGFAETLKEVNPNIGYAEYKKLAQMFLKKWKYGRWIPWQCVPNEFDWFAKSFIKRINPSKTLIPFATGFECDYFDNHAKVEYHFLFVEYEPATKYFADIQTIVEIPQNGKYDLILSALSLRQIEEVEWCSQLLSDNGYCIFTFPKSIVMNSSVKWLSKLENSGLYCVAVIDMPIGAYAPITVIDNEIFVFSKKKMEKRFVGYISEKGFAEKIVDNFLNGKSSKNAKLGAYVEGDIKCYSDLDNKNRILKKNKELEQSYHGKLVKIKEIAEIHAPTKKQAFCEYDNSVYIPKLGKSRVVTSVADFQLKAQNYFQIVVDSKKILPRFLAFFLNTEDGIIIRQLSYRGFIKSFNMKTLGEVVVPCPTVKLQLEYLKTYDQLEGLRVDIETLKNKLKKKPVSYNNIREEIKDINNTGDKFSRWIESLPYPIATILKRYSVTEKADKKQEMLLYFYEAYAIFNATLLSAALDKKLIDCSKLKDVDSIYFEKASFGNWVRMDRALSNIFLSSLNSADNGKKMAVLACFKTMDENLIKYICSKNVCNILEKASVHRNNWKAHSGITSETIYQDHVHTLDNMLNELHEDIKDLYERIRLIRQQSLRKVDGVFINTVEVLTGSNSIFPTVTVKGGSALDESKLYLQIIDNGETLELPPYFILKNSPASMKNTCYFYNKVEKGSTKYVSYYYEEKPEDTEDNELAFAHIKQLLNN